MSSGFEKRFDLGCSYSTTKQHLKRGAVLWYVGVLKNRRIIGGSREEMRIARLVLCTVFVADDTLLAMPTIFHLYPPRNVLNFA